MNGLINKFCRRLVLAGLLCVLSACSSEEFKEVTFTKDRVNVGFCIFSRADGNDAESQIKSLRVYAFDDSRLVGQYYKSLDASAESHEFTMSLPMKKIVFYVLANEAAAGDLKVLSGNVFKEFEFSKDVTPADLKSVTFAKLPVTSYDVEKMGIPMSAIDSATIDGEQQVKISLSRTVAKLNIYFAKKASKDAAAYLNRGIYLYNVPQYGYLFPQGNSQIPSLGNREQASGGITGDGVNQKNGQVVQKAAWTDDQGTTHQDNPVTKDYTPQMERIPSNYNRIPENTVYLFPNPNDDKVNKADAYYLKICWSELYLNTEGHLIAEEPTSSIYVPKVNANDNIQLFAHISVSSHLNLSCNWMITEWTTARESVEFN